MIKKIGIADWILMILALLSLIYAEIAWFNGETDAALFVGLWVPSILGFGIYLKLLKMNKNG